MILLARMLPICVSVGHQTKGALLYSGNEEHQTPKAVLEEGDHCDR